MGGIFRGSFGSFVRAQNFGLLESEGGFVAPDKPAGFGGGEVGKSEIALASVVALIEPELEVERGEAFSLEVVKSDGVSEGFGDFLTVYC